MATSTQSQPQSVLVHPHNLCSEIWVHDEGTYDLKNMTCCQRRGFDSIYVRPASGWTYWTQNQDNPYNDSLSVYTSLADEKKIEKQSAMVIGHPNVCSEMWLGDLGMVDVKAHSHMFIVVR